MYIIVGLGNPGTQYSNTHHNAGFMAVEKLADPNKDWKSEHKALTMKVNVAGEEVLFYADPPFKDMEYPDLRPFYEWLNPGGVAVFEAPSRKIPAWVQELDNVQVRRYGESSLVIYRR